MTAFSESGRAQELIRLFNELSHHLRRKDSGIVVESFASLVTNVAKKDAAVRAREKQLRDFADLRNAIVHHRFHPDRIIAEPTQEAVDEFRCLVKEICDPTPALSIASRAIQCFSPEDKLAAALAYVRERNFSQIVVRADGVLSLLTAEGVARWLEDRAEEDVISIAEAKVGDGLRCEDSDNFRCIGRTGTIDDVREIFATPGQPPGARIFAILITQNGKLTESPLGIVTPWDLLNVGQQLQVGLPERAGQSTANRAIT